MGSRVAGRDEKLAIVDRYQEYESGGRPPISTARMQNPHFAGFVPAVLLKTVCRKPIGAFLSGSMARTVHTLINLRLS